MDDETAGALATNVVALLNPSAFPFSTVDTIARQNNVLWGLAPIVERLATIFIHILANTLIFYAVVTRQPRWFWLAFAYKTAIDSVAAFAQMTGIDTLVQVWTIEAVVAVFGVLGWLGLRWLAQCYPAPEEPAEEAVQPQIALHAR
jgi:uncharacterized membrane protein YhfC